MSARQRNTDRLFAVPIIDYVGVFLGIPETARRELLAMDDEAVVNYMCRAPKENESKDAEALRHLIFGSGSELLAWRVVERARRARA